MEASYPISFQRTNWNFLKRLLIGTIIIVLVGLCGHALLHDTAQAVADRCNQNGPDIILQNKLTGHILKLCQMDDSKDEFGRIFEDGKDNNLTAFLNSVARKNTLRKAIINAVNQKYDDLIYIRESFSMKDTAIQLVNALKNGIPVP